MFPQACVILSRVCLLVYLLGGLPATLPPGQTQPLRRPDLHPPPPIRRNTVKRRSVRIQLECIVVTNATSKLRSLVMTSLADVEGFNFFYLSVHVAGIPTPADLGFRSDIVCIIIYSTTCKTK